MNRPVRSEPRPRSGGGAPWPSWVAATAWSSAAALGATFLLAVTAGLVDLLGDGDEGLAAMAHFHHGHSAALPVEHLALSKSQYFLGQT